jgi:NitT/TauT family transport system substrate-binding protein
VGSSEDFEIRGWLQTQHLTDKVSVVGFPSEAAAGAAFKSGAVDAAYVEIDQAIDLKALGARSVVTAQQIAELGFPSLNVFAVTSSFAAKHADVVQAFVCQTMNALTALKGPDASSIIGNGAKLVGAGADLAVKAVDATPYVPNDEQLKWFKDTGGSVVDGRMAKAYVLTAGFLKQQGRVTAIPTAAEIAAHIDSSFVEKAIADKCGA